MNEIKCSFFCYFHDKAGPIIVCQFPEKYFFYFYIYYSFITPDVFNETSNFLIAKEELRGKIISMYFFNKFLIYKVNLVNYI